MPDLRDASSEEIADTLPGVSEGTDIAGADDSESSDDSSSSSSSSSSRSGSEDTEQFDSKQELVKNTDGIPDSVSKTSEGELEADTSSTDSSTNSKKGFSKSTITVEEQEKNKKQDKNREIPDFGSGDKPKATRTRIDEEGNPVGPTKKISIEQARRESAKNSEKNREQLQLIERGESKKVQELQRARQKAQLQERRIRTSRSNQFKTSGGQTVSREQAIQQLETRENRLDKSIDRQRNIEQGREDLRELNSIIPQQNSQASTSEQFSNIRQENDITFDPLNRPVETVQDTVRNPAEQSVVTGVEIMQRGQEFGENIGEFAEETGVIDERTSFQPRDITSPTDAAAGVGGEIVDRGPDFFEQVTGESVPFEEQIEDADETAARGLVEGSATLGTQIGGLAVATPGATVRAFDEDTPSLQEGAAFGAQETARQVTEDPVGFASEETGEELGEAAVGAVIAGPAGLALSATPTPDIDVSPTVRAKADTAGRFVTGDLGFRGTETEVRSVPASEAPLVGESPTRVRAEAEFLQQQGVQSTTERSFEPLDGGGRAQKVERISTDGPTEEPQVTRGVRVEEPVSRTQFLQERLGLEEASVSDFIDPDGNAIGSGPGAFLPSQETDPQVEPEVEPDTNTEVDVNSLFEDTQPETDVSVDVGISRPNAVIDSDIEQGQGSGLDESILPERTQDTGQELNFEPVQEPRTDQTPDTVFESTVTPDTTQPEQELDPLVDPRLDSRTETTTSPEFDRETETNGEESLLVNTEKDLDVEESIGAELLGLEGRTSTEQAQNPLSFRQGF